MKSLFFLFFLFSSLMGDMVHTACEQKLKDSHSMLNEGVYIPINKTQRLVYSATMPDAKIIKADPFLGLYLVEGMKPFAYPFKIGAHFPDRLALVNQKTNITGKILKHQIGLNSLAVFSSTLEGSAIVSGPCCKLEGLFTPRGVIEKTYLLHFLQAKSVEYADIGIRIGANRDVVRVNPFFKNNPFLVGDVIVAYDGKKVANSWELMQKILFSKICSHHKVQILRNAKACTFDVMACKRLGGGLLSDTFLESKGMVFTHDLKLAKVSGYGLHVNDKLLSINGVMLKNSTDLQRVIGSQKGEMLFLFQRDGFQFFVHIN